MVITRVFKTDLDALFELVMHVSKSDVLPYFDKQGKQTYLARVLNDLKATFDDERFITFKAVSKNQIIGFGAMRDGNYITHLFVLKTHQGVGVGKQLLTHLIEQSNSKEIHLRSSHNAVGFYLRNGFKVAGEAGDFDGIRFQPMSFIRK